MMRHHAFRVLSALMVLAVIVAVSQPASAAILRAYAAAKVTSATQPAHCASPAVTVPPKCCYKPCITYREAGCCKKCCTSGPDIQMILRVQDPKSCCTVDVPVCVPACCQGTPCVSSRCALFCRGAVWYDWACGFSVKVVFKHNGDLVVTYVN